MHTCMYVWSAYIHVQAAAVLEDGLPVLAVLSSVVCLGRPCAACGFGRLSLLLLLWRQALTFISAVRCMQVVSIIFFLKRALCTHSLSPLWETQIFAYVEFYIFILLHFSRKF